MSIPSFVYLYAYYVSIVLFNTNNKYLVEKFACFLHPDIAIFHTWSDLRIEINVKMILHKFLFPFSHNLLEIVQYN